MPKKFARGGQDTRGAKAKAQKSAARAAKEARSAAQREAAEAADWDRGSNKRKQAREQQLKAKEEKYQSLLAVKKKQQLNLTTLNHKQFWEYLKRIWQTICRALLTCMQKTHMSFQTAQTRYLLQKI